MRRGDTPSRLVLIEDRMLAAEERLGAVRRYRLARLRLDSRQDDPVARYEHLKRVYD